GRGARRPRRAAASVLRYRGPASVVDGLPQIRRSRSRTQLRPEQVHRLLAMETMARREREQLQQRRRLASPPGLLGNLPVADAHAESTEQLDAELSQLLTSADDTAPRR